MAAPTPVISLSAKARALAKSVFGQEQLDQLAEFLQPYYPVIQKLFLGATAGAGLLHFCHRYQQNRSKLQLAIFHVLRVIENSPRFQALLQDSDRLIAEMEVEVFDLIPSYLTNAEGETVLKALKRKVDNNLGSAPRRRRLDDGTCDRDNGERRDSEKYGALRPTQGPVQDVVEDVDAGFGSAGEVPDIPEYELDTDEGSHTPWHPPVWQKPAPGRVYKAPSARSVSSDEDEASPVLPTPTPANNTNVASTPSRVYGFSYDDWSPADDDDWSLSDEDSSSENGPVEQRQQSSPPVIIPTKPKPKTMVERAMEKAFDPNSPGNRFVPRSSLFAARPKVAVKPPNPFPRTPPNQVSIVTGHTETGTDLSPIEEGGSFATSPEVEGTKYRVAESRRFYQEVETGRKEQQTSTVKKSVKKQWSIAVDSVSSSEQSELDAILEQHEMDRAQDGDLRGAVDAVATRKHSISKSSKSSGAQKNAKDFFKHLSPSKLDDSSIVEQVLAEQTDDAPWDDAILTISPSSAGRSAGVSPATSRSPALASSPATTRSPAISSSPKVDRSPAASRSPLISHPPVVAEPPKKPGRGRLPKTPQRRRESVGVSKSTRSAKRAVTPGARSTASNESVESAVSRRSTRKTLFKGKYQK